MPPQPGQKQREALMMIAYDVLQSNGWAGRYQVRPVLQAYGDGDYAILGFEVRPK